MTSTASPEQVNTTDPVLLLSTRDQQHYREFERGRDLIRDRVQSVAGQHHTGAFLVGRPGTSKTRTVEETLMELDVPSTIWNAHVSPMGLWCVMEENPESVIVVDDVSTLFSSSNKAALQVLLAGLGGEPGQPRLVRYATKDDRKSFHFSGGLIAIGNELPPKGSRRRRPDQPNSSAGARAVGRYARGIHALPGPQRLQGPHSQ